MAFSFTRLFTNYINHFLIVTQRGIKTYSSKVSRQLRKRQSKYYESLSKEDFNELHRRSNFVEWNFSSEVFAFGKRLQEEFPPELLIQAFTHRSYIIKKELQLKNFGVEDPKIDLKDNDVLAFEGEKIIHDFSGRYASYFFPRFPLEGIESIANYLSSEKVLAHTSKNLGTTFLILSADYPVKTSTYAKTLKAIVGALKECQGIKRSQLFVRDIIITNLAGKDINDFLQIKSSLQSLSQILKNEGKDPPEARIICQVGMNTILANYHVGMYSNKHLIGHCSGETINVAIEMAALDALKRLFHTTDSCRPISYDVEDIPQRISNLRLCEWSSAAVEKQLSLSK